MGWSTATTTLLNVIRARSLAVCATVVAAAVLVLPSPAGATVSAAEDSGVWVGRYGGADRYATSLLVADAVAAYAGGSLDSVVMVSGLSWRDAVVAAPTAGALGAPVLMTPPGELRADAAAFLQRTGVTSVVVVGATDGADAVGAEVIAALESLGVSVERVGRVDRYATGVVAARRVTPGVMPGLGTTAIVASGEVFADALVAGPFAARGRHPVLLTPPDRLHAGVEAHLSAVGIEHVVLMGGTGALSEAVEASITDLGISVTRLAGATRYDTAVMAAELVQGRYSDEAGEPCFSGSTVGLARARVPFDSFSAAPLLGRLCAPLLLTEPHAMRAETAAILDAARDEHDTIGLRIFGGDAAVSRSAVDSYLYAHLAAGSGLTVLPAGTCGGSDTDELRQLVTSLNAEDPAWSPDCGQFVYTQNGSLWTMNNGGSNQQRLVPYAGVYLNSAAWSPRGTQIAYVGGYQDDDDWVAHIWKVNADGTGATQLTEGNVIDASPRWSPTGELIVFDRFSDGSRHVMRMAPDGTNAEQLTSGSAHNDDPMYSPDGSQLAFITGSAVVVAEADGSNPLLIVSGVVTRGGLSWSPDGRRIAFVRSGNDRQTLFTADVRGRLQEAVYESEEGSAVLAPRWSPDGQLIAFHTIDRSGKHRVFTIGARGDPVPDGSESCRPRGTPGTTAGFPLPSWAAPSTGTLRVAVLFMDFPDVQADHSTEVEAELNLPYIEDYFESSSLGQLDVEFVPLHRWLRAEQPSTAYLGETVFGPALTLAASTHAVALADDEFDFVSVDLVLNVFPSSHFGGGNATGSATADGVTVTTTRVNTVKSSEPREPSEWGSVGTHEIAHNLGLLDMYAYDPELRPQPDVNPDSDDARVDVTLGLMGLNGFFLTSPQDSRLAHEWSSPDGVRSTGFLWQLRVREMLAWSRWQLGWLTESQVRCMNSPEAVVTLTPIAQPGNGLAMAAVPLSTHDVIVVESRRKLGYDAGRFFEVPETGASTTYPALITEGVLVYTVDTSLGSGQLPAKIAGDTGSGQVDDFPVLEAGESVTLRGYTITVVADDGDTHTVTITPQD
ncbi:cell wall-binding repeat-containing protein [Candidatus Poriferisodalis sp.]|uniref:cell wall-binding repeat-containing protein n=1 Tax=Candidatus Poriferisodalis sp. TaxID=3101277 RepID=UPI003AF4E647